METNFEYKCSNCKTTYKTIEEIKDHLELCDIVIPNNEGFIRI